MPQMVQEMALEMAGPSPSALCEPQNLEEDELATTCNYHVAPLSYPSMLGGVVQRDAPERGTVKPDVRARVCVYPRALCPAESVPLRLRAPLAGAHT